MASPQSLWSSFLFFARNYMNSRIRKSGKVQRASTAGCWYRGRPRSQIILPRVHQTPTRSQGDAGRTSSTRNPVSFFDHYDTIIIYVVKSPPPLEKLQQVNEFIEAQRISFWDACYQSLMVGAIPSMSSSCRIYHLFPAVGGFGRAIYGNFTWVLPHIRCPSGPERPRRELS